MGPRRPDGGIGRRTSFRCWRSQGRGGSSPLLGTISKSSDHYQGPEASQKACASGLFCCPNFRRQFPYTTGAATFSTGIKHPENTVFLNMNETENQRFQTRPTAGGFRLNHCHIWHMKDGPVLRLENISRLYLFHSHRKLSDFPLNEQVSRTLEFEIQRK